MLYGKIIDASEDDNPKQQKQKLNCGRKKKLKKKPVFQSCLTLSNSLSIPVSISH